MKLKLKYLGSDFGFDEDGDLKIKDGDIDIIEGRDCLAANLFDRILCSENELLLHKEFGAGLADKVSMPMSQANKDSLAVEVKHEILKDPRVKEISELEVIDEGRVIYIRPVIITIDGQIIGNLVFPFELEMAT